MKYEPGNLAILLSLSLPTWERGLKSAAKDVRRLYRGVAPYMGAWIEIVYGTRDGCGAACRSLHGSVD